MTWSRPSKPEKYTHTEYADGRILSPNTTCPRFSVGDFFSFFGGQKSKLKARPQFTQ